MTNAALLLLSFLAASARAGEPVFDPRALLQSAREGAALSESAPGAVPACRGRVSVPGPSLGELEHGRGLLWRVVAPSGAVSWVFGTEHTDEGRVIDLLRRLRPFFETSRRIVNEVDMGDKAGEAYVGGIRLPAGRKLSTLIGPELYAESERLLGAYGVSENGAESMKVWAVFNVLSRPPMRGGVVLDKLIREEGLRRRKEVLAIETVPELLEGLDSLSLPFQIESLRDTVCDYGENALHAERLGALYLAQDIGGMYAYSFHKLPADHRHVDAFMERMLFFRSERMAARLAPLLSEGGAFVGVGALHLPGPRGLLALLERRGCRVSAVDMDDPSQRPAQPPAGAVRRERAGPDAPELVGDIPELVTAAKVAEVWGIVKELVPVPEGTPPPSVRFESSDAQRMSLDWMLWVAEWRKAHPEAPGPCPKTMLSYYFEGTGVARVDPVVFRKYYQTDPATGGKRDFVGFGYYSLGHALLHYALERRGESAARHHCLLSGGGDASLSARLAARLAEGGTASAIFMLRDGVAPERADDPCGGSR
ncbi:MAG: TraB/GumN family protein [Elusimicrobiota bacterium]|jgi:hypothetical protein